MGLALALRQNLIELSLARNALIGQQDKREQLYEYLTGVQFQQRIEAIVESFHAQKKDLEREKTAMQRSWAKRDKQIERMLSNTAGMIGDLEGITGKDLPEIKTLELPGAEESEERGEGEEEREKPAGEEEND